MDINSVTIIGRLTRDAALTYTLGGSPLLKFGIALNKRVKSGDEWTDAAMFFDVTLWGKGAEAVAQYMLKGKQVGVSGELDYDTWEKEGTKHTRVSIKAHDVQLLGGGDQAATKPTAKPAPKTTDNYERKPTGTTPEPDGFEDDSIPF